MNTPAHLAIPCRVNHAFGVRQPGQADAGWSVYNAPSIEARDAFMAQNPQAAMPCWARFVAGSTVIRS